MSIIDIYIRDKETNIVRSADAVPTVIRSKTLLPTKDFKEWAKRIKEVNPNAVVIPCDAEVASADAVHGEWVRKYDDKINCYWYECDQCGEYRPRNQFGKEYNANFCPNCGADMRENYEHATLVDIKEPLKVAVVRCKDCRWYKYDSYCSKTEGREIDADNFCSYGERREP